MKKGVALGLILLLFLFVPLAVMSQDMTGPGDGKGGTGSGTTFCVMNPNHVQMLGGKSAHAAVGLAVAATHSQRITVVEVSPKGK